MYEAIWAAIGGIVCIIFQIIWCYVIDPDWSEPSKAVTVVRTDLASNHVVHSHGHMNDVAYHRPEDLLDSCAPARSRLRYVERVLSEQAGVEPGSGCEVGKMISNAVYEGRQVYSCIRTLNPPLNHEEPEHV
jgi:hypothetical protein